MSSLESFILGELYMISFELLSPHRSKLRSCTSRLLCDISSLYKEGGIYTDPQSLNIQGPLGRQSERTDYCSPIGIIYQEKNMKDGAFRRFGVYSKRRVYYEL